MTSAISNLKRGPIVASLIIAAFVAILAQTLLNIALPSIMKDLDIEENTAQWLITGYMLVNGVLIPISAYMIERFTTRKLFIVAVSLFTIGTIVSAVAYSFPVLLTGRLIQAAGAGILMPLMSIVFLTIFPVAERGKAMGMMGLAMIFAPAVGPTLSGWIVEHYSWRVLFYILLPIILFALIYGSIAMKNVTRNAKSKLDYFAVVLSTLGFGGILYGFSDAGTDGWDNSTVYTSLIIGVVSLILFIWRELVVEKPMLELRVFKFGMYSLTTVINVIVTMAMYSGMILLPLYLQTIRGFTPLESGLLLLPGAILMGIMSPITGIIFDKIGARWLGVVGLAVTAVTTYMLSTLTEDTSYASLITIYSFRMFGMSLIMMPIQTAGMNQLPQRLNAHGSAMQQTLRNVAGALGAALLVTIMTNKTKEVVKELIISSGVNPQDETAVQPLQLQAMIEGINHSFVVATWFAVIAFVLAFFIKKVKPHEEKTVETSKHDDQAKAKVQTASRQG